MKPRSLGVSTQLATLRSKKTKKKIKKKQKKSRSLGVCTQLFFLFFAFERECAQTQRRKKTGAKKRNAECTALIESLHRA
jgi:hypothetical protein